MCVGCYAPDADVAQSTSRSAASGIAISLSTMRHVDIAQQPELDLVSSLKTHPYLA